MKSSTAKLSLAALAALGGVAGFVHDTHAAVVINEVYGAGGGLTATQTYAYNTDFFELYNNGTSAIDLTGLSLRYASATGAFTTTGTTGVGVLPAFSLAPGQFFLVSGLTSTTYVGPALPAVDATSNISASGTAGKVALYASDGTTVLDLVAYGSTTTGFEGLGAAPTLTNTSSVFRTVTGVDTNNNNLDFSTGTPTPQGVPEPTSLGLAAVGSALLLRRRRHG
ncbi:MAG: hypothetical protein JWO31_3152 [Phycisphaerales bacterium]|nr:hypothetical protein [Phycisphaerales bacterium]